MSAARLSGAAALAILLAANAAGLASAMVQVCGADYADATSNCKANPPCPTGDGCPPSKETCFALPQSQCFSPPVTPPPTDEPTGAPTPAPLRVCGSNYGQALTGCRTNPGCPTGDGCPMGAACFTIPASLCPTLAPTPAPTPMPKVCGYNMANAQANCADPAKHCLTGGGCGIGDACFPVPADLCGVTQEPTPGPTTAPPEQPDPGVCATDAASAMAACLTLEDRCPDSGICPPGQACFRVEKDSCGKNPGSQAGQFAGGMQEPDEAMDPNDGGVPPGGQATVPPVMPSSVCGDNWGDVVAKCRTNPPCPTGDGCPIGMTCYDLPPGTCPELEETPPETPLPVAPSAPKMTLQPTPQPTDEVTSVAFTPQTTSGTPANPSASPSASPTMPPTKSPVYNVFFCGATYLLAEQNCWKAESCGPAGGCSKPGEDCYGISLTRCLSPAPTDAPTNPGPQPTDEPTGSHAPTSSPTVSPKPTSAPTPSPSEAPTVNTWFCGETYNDAVSTCAMTQPCPSGAGCPGGKACFSGIICSAPSGSGPDSNSGMGPPSSTPDKGPGSTPDMVPGSTSGMVMPPTGSAPVMSPTPGSGTIEPPTPKPISLADALGVTPTSVLAPTGSAAQVSEGADEGVTPMAGTESPSASPVTFGEALGLGTGAPTPNNKFCGLNPRDAAERCATTGTPCPDGTSQACFGGQTCFAIPGNCGEVPPDTPPGASIGGPVPDTPPGAGVGGGLPNTTTGAGVGGGLPNTTPGAGVGGQVPGVPPSNPSSEEVEMSSYCGANITDAELYCYERTPCPSGSAAECPRGMSCFQNIVNCEISPSMAAAVDAAQTNPPSVAPPGSGATSSPSKKPAAPGTPRPTYNWDLDPPSGGVSSILLRWTQKSVVLGGAIWGALML